MKAGVLARRVVHDSFQAWLYVCVCDMLAHVQLLRAGRQFKAHSSPLSHMCILTHTHVLAVG